MSNPSLRFQRILLKLSGEALAGREAVGIDPQVLEAVASEVLSVHHLGVQVAIVIGGGNIFRGLQSSKYKVGRVRADDMGMLATLINAIALADVIEHMGGKARVMTAIEMPKIGDLFTAQGALRHLSKGRVLVLGGGTGNPFFTTDTAAALRALEIGAEALLKATKVDGVYDSDPETNPSAKFFPRLSYAEVLKRRLRVMDLTAISLAMEQNLPVIVFNLRRQGNLLKAVSGEDVGTLVTGEE